MEVGGGGVVEAPRFARIPGYSVIGPRNWLGKHLGRILTLVGRNEEYTRKVLFKDIMMPLMILVLYSVQTLRIRR